MKQARLFVGNTLALVSSLIPLAALAQAEGQADNPDITIAGIFARLTELFNRLIPFLVLLGTVLFMWGVVKYIGAGDDEDKIKEARNIIMYGIIALAAMVVVWALVAVLHDAILGGADVPLPGPDLDPFLDGN